jgi:hypothetical protein
MVIIYKDLEGECHNTIESTCFYDKTEENHYLFSKL